MSDALKTAFILNKEFAAIHGEERLLTMPDPNRDPNESFRRYTASVHELAKNGVGQTALCLSGGGIRSAAFALGILQGLARHRLLSQFHYLSTVSGGGYIGGWLVAWASRPRGAPKAKTGQQPAFTTIQEELAGEKTPPPLTALRERRAFLTPRTGLASPDTWMAIAHVLRNMILNWIVFIPLLGSLLLLPRFAALVLRFWSSQTPASLDTSILQVVTAASRAVGLSEVTPRFVFAWQSWLDLVAAALVAVGLGFSMANRSVQSTRAMGDKGFVRWVLVPILAGAFLLIATTCSWLALKGLTPGMRREWVVLCGVMFAVIRLIAEVAVWLWVGIARHMDRPLGVDREHVHPVRFLLELVAQVVAGALVGFVIWLGLDLWVSSGPDVGMVKVTVFGLPWFLLAFLLGQTLLSGLTTHLFPCTGDRNREWLARASGWYGAAALGWMAFSFVSLLAWAVLAKLPTYFAGVTAVSGLGSILGGASPLSKFASATGADSKNVSRFLTILSVVFIFCLGTLIAHGTDLLAQAAYGHLIETGLGSSLIMDLQSWAEHVFRPRSIGGTGHEQASLLLAMAVVASVAVALAVLSAAASWFVNVNYFSLAALYRNRLIRAFLGSSNVFEVTGEPANRNPFDGLAEADNIAMADLAGGQATGGPFLLVNITLNLTATRNNAWQERKAASFTATRLHVGGSLVGYRPASDYAAIVPTQANRPTRGLTLGSAMAISGAAVSPNWGYHSSPLTSFLMAIFNVRLGSWLGNPSRPRKWRKDGPRMGFQLFWQEALGHSSADSNYVYLSDGGHFDNLGLYEAVRRRCRVIVVSDAGADQSCKLEDLGNAIRKIEVDMDGVRIEFDEMLVSKRGKERFDPGVYCAIGHVIYPEAGSPRGTIVYIKPGLYNDLPADVRAYAAANAKFPHDTTLNQWFTESQFESYRALGEHAIRMIACERSADGEPVRDPDGIVVDSRPLALGEFVARARAYVGSYSTQTRRPMPVRVIM